MIVADTDVLIDFLNDRGAASAVAREIERGTLATTTITRFELLSGARTERQHRAVSDLLAVLPALPFDERASDRAAIVRLDLERKGLRIGMADFMIAGIALAHEARLLTRNRRQFERVPSLALIDPG